MAPAGEMPKRTKRQGRFSFEGVSFGYVYWGPIDPKADSTHIVNTSAASFAKLPGYGGANPLVLLHGFGQSAQSWEPVVAVLDPLRSVWAFELLGHGESDRPSRAQTYDLDFQGQALLAFLESLAQGGNREAISPLVDSPAAWEERAVMADSPCHTTARKFTLLGYSMGGRVALAAMTEVERFAQVVSQVVLESAGLGSPTLEAQDEATRKDTFHANKLREEGLEAFFDYWETLPLFASQKKLPQEARQALRDERLRNSAQALAATFEWAGQHCMPLREAVYERLRAIRAQGVQLDYLAGERDLKYVALAEEAAQAIALSVTEVPDCGHNIHSELAAQN